MITLRCCDVHCVKARDATHLYGSKLVNAHLLLLAVSRSFAARLKSLTDEILNATQGIVRCRKDSDALRIDIDTLMGAWRFRVHSATVAGGKIVVGDDQLMDFQYSRGAIYPDVIATYVIQGVKPDDVRVVYDVRVDTGIDTALAHTIIERLKPGTLLTFDLNDVISRYEKRSSSARRWRSDRERAADSLYFRLYVAVRPCTESPEHSVSIEKIEMPALNISTDTGHYVIVGLHDVDGHVYAVHYNPEAGY